VSWKTVVLSKELETEQYITEWIIK